MAQDGLREDGSRESRDSVDFWGYGCGTNRE